MKVEVAYSEDGSAKVKLYAESPVETLVLVSLERTGVKSYSGDLRHGSKRQEGAATFRDGVSFSFAVYVDVPLEEDLCNKPIP